jgi:hypothetical protein
MKSLIAFSLFSSCFSLSLYGQSTEDFLQAEFVFEVRAELSAPEVIGESSDGVRQAIPITGGDFSGPDIQGVVLPGGADYQTTRPDGVTEVHAVYMIRTNDGALINVVNDGIIVPGENGSAPYIRTTPQFKAPLGKYEWLNKTVFLTNLVVKPERPGMVFVRVYKVL